MTDTHGRGPGTHLATVSHDGRFWDVYLDFDEDLAHPDSYRGFLRFAAADGNADEMVRTTAILIEDSDEQVVSKARSMQDHMLVALLRSALPD